MVPSRVREAERPGARSEPSTSSFVGTWSCNSSPESSLASLNLKSRGSRLKKNLAKLLKPADEQTEQEDDKLETYGEPEGKNDFVLPQCNGCLGVHVKKCKDFTPKYTFRPNTWVMVRISINEYMKCTDLELLTETEDGQGKDVVVHFINEKYFPIEVPRRASDERNLILLELVEVKMERDLPRLLARATVHLYEIIKRGCCTATCPMKNRDMVFCFLEVKFMFCYGCLGYGNSPQLSNPKLQRPTDRTMFPRPPPTKDGTHPYSNDISAEPKRYASFLPPKLFAKVTLHNKKIPAVSDLSSEETLPEGTKELSAQTSLEKMINEYDNLKTWQEKREYLDRLVLKTGPQRIAKPNTADHTEHLFENEADGENIPAFPDVSADYQLAMISEKESELEGSSPQPAGCPEQIWKTAEEDPFTTIKHEHPEEEILPATSETSTLLEKKATEPDVSEVVHSTEVSKIVDTLKSDESAKKLPLLLNKMEFKAAVPRKDKFEPFLGPVDRSQAIPLSGKKEEVVPLFDLLEEIEGTEEEDRDPSLRTASTEDLKISLNTSNKNNHCPSSIMSVKLEEECQKLSSLNDKELLSLAIEGEVFAKEQEQPCSETKMLHLTPSLTKVLEESLVDAFINIIILKSVLGRSLEEVIKVSEAAIDPREVGEEYQKWQCVTPVASKSSIYDGQNISFAEGQTANVKSIVSQSPQHHPMERFFERSILPHLELGKKDQVLSAQKIQEGSSVILETESAGSSCSAEESTSETDITSFRYVLNQNQSDFPVESLIEMRSTEGVQLENKHQHSILPNIAVRRPEHETDFPDGRKQKFLSETELSIIKALKRDLQDHCFQTLSQTGLVKGTDAEYECQKIPLQSVKGMQLVDTAMDLPEKENSCEVRTTKTETTNLKSPLPQRLSKTELGKDSQTTSLDVTSVRLPLDVETELPRVGQDHHQQKPSELEVKSVSNQTLQDTLIGRVLETEIMNLKPLINKFLHRHLTEKISGQMMEEKLKKVHENLSSLSFTKGVAQGIDLVEIDQDNCSDNLAQKSIIKGKSALSESMQNLLLELLPEKEIMNLKSILSKKIQDHLVERLAKIGLITKEELRKVKEKLRLLRASRAQLEDSESGLPEEEQSPSPKFLLYPDLQDEPSEMKHLKYLTDRISEDSKDSISETEATSSEFALSNTPEDLQTGNIWKAEILHNNEESDLETQIGSDTEARNEKHELCEDEFPDPVPNEVVNINEEQANGLMAFIKKIINTFEKENQDQKREMALSKEDFERPLSQKTHDEIEASEAVNSSSFSNACDAIIQTDPCNTQPFFPVSFPQSMFSQVDPEEKGMPSTSLDLNSRDKLGGKAHKKYAVPFYEHLGQILTSTPSKKEKQTNSRKSRQNGKEKHGKHYEATPSTSSPVGYRESESPVFPCNKENLKKKEQEKEHDNKPRKSVSKSVRSPSDPTEQQSPQAVKAFKENSFPNGLPDPGSASVPMPCENLPNHANEEDLKIKVCKYLETAVERALQELRGAPAEQRGQPLHSARPHSGPPFCGGAKETPRAQAAASSIAFLDCSLGKDPGNTTRLKFQNQNTEAKQVEIHPKKKIHFSENLKATLVEDVAIQSDDK